MECEERKEKACITALSALSCILRHSPLLEHNAQPHLETIAGNVRTNDSPLGLPFIFYLQMSSKTTHSLAKNFYKK